MAQGHGIHKHALAVAAALRPQWSTSLCRREVVPRRVLRPARPLDPGFMGSDGQRRTQKNKSDTDVNMQPDMCLRQMLTHSYIIIKCLNGNDLTLFI